MCSMSRVRRSALLRVRFPTAPSRSCLPQGKISSAQPMKMASRLLWPDNHSKPGDFRVGANGRKAPGLEWLSGQSKRDAIFIGCAYDILPCGKHEREGAVGKRTLSKAERLTRDI